jgi:hypothetical protein
MNGRIGLILFIVAALMLPTASLGADQETAERLVQELWADFQAGRIKAVADRIAGAFQSINEREVRTREMEIRYLRTLKIERYSLSDLRVTEEGPVTLVTYVVSADGTFNGKPLFIRSARRLSFFIKTEKGWEWLGHANFSPQRY